HAVQHLRAMDLLTTPSSVGVRCACKAIASIQHSICRNHLPTQCGPETPLTKQPTYFRAGGKNEVIRLTPPRKMTLEQAIAYVQDDELVEATRQSIRLHKRYLDPHERKKITRKEGYATPPLAQE